MMTHAMLTGKSDTHLTTLSGHHRLHPETILAFQAMQRAAAQQGFALQPASTFRDFERQRLIWNGKFRGERPVLGNDGKPLNVLTLSEGERCQAILRWSAMPGASRHHWGSDLDIYDPTLLPEGEKLRLEPWEFEAGGYFAPLNAWLSQHMHEYGFYRPYAHDLGGVAAELWHISYYPLAQYAEGQLTSDIIRSAWQGEDIAGSDWLCEHLPYLFTRFIHNVDGA
ncbi:M15 family metallopeptidase [Brenneria rubrifaciens]|uniref:D-alanyl-D-alanine carboxypeptidase family protein n=1 Tax=Brenneria rubrifaciens TaxID=55213 RepID=A0A4P8QX55_9GAMM|nr:M15 family metallopeptidase [Brenneria rubrifaciens]QCR07974.1 D-alanyl-D-alanine carboxypeptidase family protein [Brenneria rubrifaciens]